MRPGRQDPHTLAGAYALDALTDRDRRRFERHLAGCEDCRLEAGGLREAASRLAAAAAAEPPPELRGAVLAEASRTRQERPVAGAAGGRLTAWRRGGAAGAARAGRDAGHPGAVGAPARPGTPGERGERGTLPLLAPRLASAIAGMAILIALGLGALTLHTRRQIGLDQVRGGAVAAVLTAPDATMMSARGRGGGTATVVMSHQRHELVLTTARLPALPAGDRYEVWLMGPAGARPAGMLPAPSGGMTAPMVVPGLLAGDRIGVTMEHGSGAAKPSSALVVMLTLPS